MDSWPTLTDKDAIKLEHAMMSMYQSLRKNCAFDAAQLQHWKDASLDATLHLPLSCLGPLQRTPLLDQAALSQRLFCSQASRMQTKSVPVGPESRLQTVACSPVIHMLQSSGCHPKYGPQRHLLVEQSSTSPDAVQAVNGRVFPRGNACPYDICQRIGEEARCPLDLAVQDEFHEHTALACRDLPCKASGFGFPCPAGPHI